MTPKAARRFLRRNELRMIKHRTKIEYQKPAFIRRWRTATSVLLQEGKERREK